MLICGKKSILFWVACAGTRDVGWYSVPCPNATTIEQEGVYLDNFKLVDRGRFRERALRRVERREISARNPLQNVNDLKAQIAANEKRARTAQDGGAFHLPVVKAYMRHVQDNAAESVRRVIDRPHDSVFPTRWTRALSSR